MCVCVCYSDKLCSDMSYSAVGHKLRVTKPVRCVTRGISQQKCTQEKIMYSSVGKSMNGGLVACDQV